MTVAVCVSGRSPHFRRSLDAIIALDSQPLDVLVIDYGSTSHIEAMLRAEARGLMPRLRHREENVGVDSRKRPDAARSFRKSFTCTRACTRR